MCFFETAVVHALTSSGFTTLFHYVIFLTKGYLGVWVSSTEKQRNGNFFRSLSLSLSLPSSLPPPYLFPWDVYITLSHGNLSLLSDDSARHRCAFPCPQAPWPSPPLPIVLQAPLLTDQYQSHLHTWQEQSSPRASLRPATCPCMPKQAAPSLSHHN